MMFRGLVSGLVVSLVASVLVAAPGAVAAQVPAKYCAGVPATIVAGAPSPAGEFKVVRGTPGDDVIFATFGDDEIWTGGGNDLVCAGPGHDRIHVEGGRATVHAGFGYDYIDLTASVGNNLVFAGPGGDRILDGPGNSRIGGGPQNDTIFGGGGDDVILGGDGNDTLDGGPGADTIRGEAGDDRIESGGDGVVSDGAVDVLDGGAGNDSGFVGAEDQASAIEQIDAVEVEPSGPSDPTDPDGEEGDGGGGENSPSSVVLPQPPEISNEIPADARVASPGRDNLGLTPAQETNICGRLYPGVPLWGGWRIFDISQPDHDDRHGAYVGDNRLLVYVWVPNGYHVEVEGTVRIYGGGVNHSDVGGGFQVQVPTGDLLTFNTATLDEDEWDEAASTRTFSGEALERVLTDDHALHLEYPDADMVPDLEFGSAADAVLYEELGGHYQALAVDQQTGDATYRLEFNAFVVPNDDTPDAEWVAEPCYLRQLYGEGWNAPGSAWDNFKALITGCVGAGLAILEVLAQIAGELKEFIQNPVAWVEAQVAEIRQVVDDLMTDASQTVKNAIKVAIGYEQMRSDPWGWAGNIGCSLIIDALVGTLAVNLAGKVRALIRDRNPDIDLDIVLPPFTLKAPTAKRHRIELVDQSVAKKDVNTVAMPTVDMPGDIQALNAGQGVRDGNLWTVNGRTYSFHTDGPSKGTTFPVDGSGFHKLSRGEYEILADLNSISPTSRAVEIILQPTRPHLTAEMVVRVQQLRVDAGLAGAGDLDGLL